MKTLLLTGIGGSIGCHAFAHIMRTTDWNVVGIDSFRHRGLTDRIETMLRAHPEDRDRLKLVTHDLRAPLSAILTAQIGHIDYIINMASLSDVKDSIAHAPDFFLANVQIILNMLEYARVAKPEVFMQISTDEVYGPSDGMSFHREWDPILPSNPYSASKASQEAACISYWRTFGVPVILINMMNNFGEMQSPSKFPSMVQRKIVRGETITVHASLAGVGSRFYLHSRNAADAMLYILKNKTPHLHVEGGVDRPDRFNIAGDGRLTNLEMVKTLGSLMGVAPTYTLSAPTDRPGFDAHYGLDGGKLAAFGWKAPKSLIDAITGMVQWHQEHPEWIDPK